MKLFKYTTLDVIANYLQNSIKNEITIQDIQFHASNFIAGLDILEKLDKQLNLAVINIENNKGVLPDGLINIKSINYTLDTLSKFKLDSLSTIEDNYGNLIIFQKLYYDLSHFKSLNLKPLRFKGQNKILYYENFSKEVGYCNDCEDGFTIDKNLKCIYLDTQLSKYSILLTYESVITDLEGIPEIPDDRVLHQAIADYITSKVAEDIALKNPKYFEIADKFRFQSEVNYIKFRNKVIRNKFSTRKHRLLNKRRF